MKELIKHTVTAPWSDYICTERLGAGVTTVIFNSDNISRLRLTNSGGVIADIISRQFAYELWGVKMVMWSIPLIVNRQYLIIEFYCEKAGDFEFYTTYDSSTFR